MPFPRGRRLGRRTVGGMVLLVAVLSLVGLTPIGSAAYADDDYPYAGLGTCPLKPAPKPPKQPGPQTGPGHRPGGPHGHLPPGQTKPGHTKPGVPGQQPGPPTKPPAPPPPPVCAKHIWLYNGSYGDPWGFALRNCTSFVAWRLRERNGLTDFTGDYGGASWGDADNWDNVARGLGYVVDDVPAVGAVAQTDHGHAGHVAWVEAVGDGTVTVEEYNYFVPGGYDVRTVPTSTFTYLHLADLAPAPYLGSTRAAVATADPRGGSWFARVTAAGDLVVRRPSGRAATLGAPGRWSPQAAPALVTDARGRVWVSAVTSAGRVLAAHTTGRPAFGRMRDLMPGATTSSPDLAVDGSGRLRIFAVSASGALSERHTVGAADRWSRIRRVGRPGSWSTHAAPSAAVDAHGEVWLAAVTQRGSLLTRRTVHHGAAWGAFRRVPGAWSVTSTPALTAAPDGRVWLAGVTSRGDLTTRHADLPGDRWHAARTLPGRWSPYASASVTVDTSGRTWLAGVRDDGHVVVLSAPAHDDRWRPSPDTRLAESRTASPSLTTMVGSVLLGATDQRGHAVWRRPSGPSSQAVPGIGPRGGGFWVSRFL